MIPAERASGPGAVTLDLWHTLLYLEPEAEEAYMRAQVELATEVLREAPLLDGDATCDPAEIRRRFEVVYADAIDASQLGRSVGPARQIAQAGLRVGRRPDPARYLDRLGQLVARTPFLPAPDALGVLRELRRDGWALGVVSNTVGEPGAALRPILGRMGFPEVVRTFVFSDEEPWTKPAPEIFEAAARRLGAEPQRTVHVGDGWVDIEGARRAGFRAGVLFTGLQHYGERYRRLFLPEGWSSPSTPYRLASWPELPCLLGRLP